MNNSGKNLNIEFNVSVIIPVYNAAGYVTKAVESALSQQETMEVVLVEDFSPDNSLEVCQELARKYEKVKLFQHRDKRNHGAGASRNLGIKKASGEFISFLDADDYYLPGYFECSREILINNPDIDGVYGATGFHYYEESLYKKELFRKKGINVELTTIKEVISPNKLFEKMGPIGDKGHFHLDGLVIRKLIFNKCGYFNTGLKLCQDTHMCIKMAAVGKLVTGSIDKPIAMRGVHEENRSTANHERVSF